MAKPFKYPQIKALEVGQSCVVFGDKAVVKRSADAFGGRNNRRFQTRGAADDSTGLPVAIVTRLPDPVAEQSEAA